MLDTRQSSRITSYRYRYGVSRKPDWRLQRANEYSVQPHLCAADRFTQILVYVATGDKRRCKFYGEALAGLMESAFAIRNDRATRLPFESRLLAYRDIDAASQLCGISGDVAKVYADAFFDVLDRIDARVWIKNHVIDDGFYGDDHLRCQLYRDAYFGGPHAVEHWLKHLPYVDNGIAHDLETVEGRERERLEILLLRRKLRMPFSANIQLAFEVECGSSPVQGTKAIAAILGDFAVSELNKRIDAGQLARAFSNEVERKPSPTSPRRQPQTEPSRDTASHTAKRRKTA